MTTTVLRVTTDSPQRDHTAAMRLMLHCAQEVNPPLVTDPTIRPDWHMVGVIYLAVRPPSAVGVAIVGTVTPWGYRTHPDKRVVYGQTARIPAVAGIYVSPACRRQGVGRALIGAIAQDMDCDPADLGWMLPFSADGERLVRAIAGERPRVGLSAIPGAGYPIVPPSAVVAAKENA